MSTNDEGWKVAGGKKSRSRRGPNRSKVAAIMAAEATGAAFVMNKNPQLSVREMTNDHNLICMRWQQQSINLRTLISNIVADHDPVDTAICLGIGSFDPGPDHSSWQRTSHIQLEAFLIIVGILEKHSSKKIKCYAQEPAFVPNDKAYLETLGIEAVEIPEAYRYVNSRTFVYGIHLPHRVWGHVLQDSLPALCVGTSLTGLESFSLQDLATTEVINGVCNRIREMELSLDKFVFPEACSDYTFSYTDMYWAKKETDADGDRELEPPMQESESEIGLADGSDWADQLSSLKIEG